MNRGPPQRGYAARPQERFNQHAHLISRLDKETEWTLGEDGSWKDRKELDYHHHQHKPRRKKVTPARKGVPSLRAAVLQAELFACSVASRSRSPEREDPQQIGHHTTSWRSRAAPDSALSPSCCCFTLLQAPTHKTSSSRKCERRGMPASTSLDENRNGTEYIEKTR